MILFYSQLKNHHHLIIYIKVFLKWLKRKKNNNQLKENRILSLINQKILIFYLKDNLLHMELERPIITLSPERRKELTR